MNPHWKTHAIGRHFIDVPKSAHLVEQWTYDRDALQLLSSDNDGRLEQLVNQQEAQLKKQVQKSGKTSFVERVLLVNGSVTLVSWDVPYSEDSYSLDTYFKAGDKIIRYPTKASVAKKEKAIVFFRRCSEKWREIPSDWNSEGIGFIVGNTILADDFPNYESWSLLIQLPGKPDVAFQVSSYVISEVQPNLRERAGGIVAGMLGTVAGFSRLRNHARPVGPIQADEILVEGSQNGKRCYGFKWEAPGKPYSLAEPNLNISLQVNESTYQTNAESFSGDEEALELWDAVVSSIRLRPGAV
jgi:hypothetical protein